jgi:hypothetical protein
MYCAKKLNCHLFICILFRALQSFDRFYARRALSLYLQCQGFGKAGACSGLCRRKAKIGRLLVVYYGIEQISRLNLACAWSPAPGIVLGRDCPKPRNVGETALY